MACSISEFTIEPVLNLMKLTLRAAGSSGVVLREQVGARAKVALALRAGFDHRVVGRAERADVRGSGFGNGNEKHALRRLREIDHAVRGYGDDLADFAVAVGADFFDDCPAPGAMPQLLRLMVSERAAVASLAEKM